MISINCLVLSTILSETNNLSTYISVAIFPLPRASTCGEQQGPVQELLSRFSDVNAIFGGLGTVSMSFRQTAAVHWQAPSMFPNSATVEPHSTQSFRSLEDVYPPVSERIFARGYSTICQAIRNISLTSPDYTPFYIEYDANSNAFIPLPLKPFPSVYLLRIIHQLLHPWLVCGRVDGPL